MFAHLRIRHADVSCWDDTVFNFRMYQEPDWASYRFFGLRLRTKV